jgi:hypothetical protein
MQRHQALRGRGVVQAGVPRRPRQRLPDLHRHGERGSGPAGEQPDSGTQVSSTL